jgi:hypothetical protein
LSGSGIHSAPTDCETEISYAVGADLSVSPSLDPITSSSPDVSARDNNMLAQAAGDIANAMQQLETLLQGTTNAEFKRLATDLVLTFAGEIPEDRDLKTLINQPPAPTPPLSPVGTSPGTREGSGDDG